MLRRDSRNCCLAHGEDTSDKVNNITNIVVDTVFGYLLFGTEMDKPNCVIFDFNNRPTYREYVAKFLEPLSEIRSPRFDC